MPTPNIDPNQDQNLPPSGNENPDDNGEGKQGKLSADERIGELVGEVKQLREQLNQKPAMETPPPPPNKPSQPTTPEVQRAIDYLEGLGFVREPKLNERLKVVDERSALNSEHTRLENDYSGTNGEPKYDRAKIENFMRERGIFDPRAAYKIMYEPELTDLAIKKATSGQQRPKTHIEKPGASTREQGSVLNWGDDSITREKVAQSITSPAGRAWYEKNRMRILEMNSRGEL